MIDRFFSDLSSSLSHPRWPSSRLTISPCDGVEEA
jgi:hypothetical protein